MSAPKVIAFDVIETLFSLENLRPRMSRMGLPEHALETVFASLLRDAFALSGAGDYVPFKEVASSVLGQMGVPQEDRNLFFEGFAELDAHPDVRSAMEALHDADVPILCLTNGNPDVTDTLLERNGLSDLVARTISIDEIGVWKPKAKVYTYAADAMGVAPDKMALIACHPWDCHGALRSGCRAGFVRRNAAYGSAMAPVEAKADDLTTLVGKMLGQS